MVESERGCGWRVMGGVYLVCEGESRSCDGLPVEMAPCHCCDFTVQQARSMQPIHAGYLANLMRGHKCRDEYPCPICFFGAGYHSLKADIDALRARLAIPWEKKTEEMRNADEHIAEELRKLEATLPKVFYLMFVSKEFYTVESFLEESRQFGISKRVAANSLPKGFVVGTDWVFLAHGSTPIYAKGKDGQVLPNEVRHATGIFHAFKPQRLEVLMWKGTDDQTIADYEDAGYSVVLIEKTPENLKRHGNQAPPPLPYGFKSKRKLKSKLKLNAKSKARDDKRIGADFDKGELGDGEE